MEAHLPELTSTTHPGIQNYCGRRRHSSIGALEASEFQGSECLFVDDHAENLPSVEVLGIRAIHHATDPATTAALLDSLLLDDAPTSQPTFQAAVDLGRCARDPHRAVLA